MEWRVTQPGPAFLTLGRRNEQGPITLRVDTIAGWHPSGTDGATVMYAIGSHSHTVDVYESASTIMSRLRGEAR